MLRRITEIGGPVYEFIEFCLDGRTDLSISELRDLILQTLKDRAELTVVVLVEPSRLTLLGERIVAALGHARAREALGGRLDRVLVGEAIGGGGIGDVRRLWRLSAGEGAEPQSLVVTEDVLKIVERPHRNLVNTDLEILESSLPGLTSSHPDQLTPFFGVGRGLRRGEWTLVQRLAYQESFTSFQDILSDVSDLLCNPVIIVELLKQSARALQVLHSEGIAHRDFKADAVLVTFEPGLTRALAQRLAGPRPALAVGLYRRCIQARIYDFDTVGVQGREKDPNRTTSSSENARIENPRELSQVFVESDQYPLGIAAMRLFPDLWGDIRGVMKHGMAVAVPMKIMFVRQTLEARRRHYITTYATLYRCPEKVAAELVDIVLRLIAFEPEDRFQDLGEMVRRLDAIQGALPTEPLLGLIQANAALFDDAEDLISGLLADRPLRLIEPEGAPKAAAPSNNPPISWALALALGLVVGGGGLYLLQDRIREPRPDPTPISIAPAPTATPAPLPTSPPGGGSDPSGPRVYRLALDSLDESALYQVGDLKEGELREVAFRTESGEAGVLRITRGEGEDRWEFSFEAEIGQERRTFPSSRVPIATLTEEVLSTLFSNYCSPSDPERIRRFIQRMPNEPVLEGPTLTARFTLCAGGEAAVLPVHVARQSATRFRLGVGDVVTVSTAPRVDLCIRVAEALGPGPGGADGLGCDSIGLKLAHSSVSSGEPTPKPGEGPRPPLRTQELSIDGETAEIIWASDEISAMADNVRVRLKIRGKGEVEIIKRPGMLLYNGRPLTISGAVSVKSALMKAIHRSAEGGE